MNSTTDPRLHYRYCPRCGKLGDFNSTNHSFRCKSCAFEFFLNSAAAVTALIFNSENKILLTRRAIEPHKGELDLPGGFVDPGENVEHALFRELKEEMNIVPESVAYFGSFPNRYEYAGVVVFTIDMVFRCEVNDVSNIEIADDITSIEFFDINQIPINSIPFESVRNILLKLKDEQNSK